MYKKKKADLTCTVLQVNSGMDPMQWSQGCWQCHILPADTEHGWFPPCFLGLTQSDSLVVGLRSLLSFQLVSSWGFSCPLNQVTFLGTWFSIIFLKPWGGIETVMDWISPLPSSIPFLDQGWFFTLRTCVNIRSTQNNPEKNAASQGHYHLPVP